MAQGKTAPNSCYRISVRGEVPLDLVDRVSFLHASALLEKLDVPENSGSSRESNRSNFPSHS